MIRPDGSHQAGIDYLLTKPDGRIAADADTVDGLHADDSGAADAHVVATNADGDVKLQSIIQSTAIASRATRGTAQTIPNATVTIINYDTVVYDQGSCITTGANWRYTAKVAGAYRISAGFQLITNGAFTDGETLMIIVSLNGASAAVIDYVCNIPPGAPNVASYGSTELSMAVDDYIDVRAFQNSGSARDLVNNSHYNWITISRIA